MNTSNIKSQFIDTLRATNREGMEDVISFIERYGFFTVNNDNQHPSRPAQHYWDIFQKALQNASQSHLNKDSLAICSLLQGVCKCYGMNHLHAHSSRSIAILSELGLKLNRDEALAIRFPMGKLHRLQADEFNGGKLRKAIQ